MSGQTGPATTGQEQVMQRGAHRGLRILRIASIPALALLAAACSSSGSPSPEGSSPLADLFRGAPPPVAVADTSGGVKVLESCPNVELRQGAATLTINNNPRDPSAMQLRYQVAITQTARECRNNNGTLAIRVGMQGRIVLGPAGTQGSLEIPIRYALVEEGPEPKTIYTKLYRVPVTIPEGASSVAFTHIEEAMTVPMPSPAVFEHYVIYIGFDALGAAQQHKPAPKKRTPKQS